MKATGFWAAARNAALKVVAFWVLVFAAYLALGRQFFPYIERLQPELETWLTSQLGTEVSIGQLSGEWVRFNPVIHMQDVRLGDALSVSDMTLAPGIYESISRGGLSFIRFEIADFSAELIQTVDGWQMTGLATDTEQTSISLPDLLTLLRRQEEVSFSNTHLRIYPLELPSFELTLDSGRLTGFEGENGLVAQATLTANAINIPIELQVEMSENAAGHNRIYFRHGEIDISPWLNGVNEGVESAKVAGEYWVNLSGEQWQSATARLSVPALVFRGGYDEIRLQDAKLESYVEREANGFEAWLNVLEYSLNDQLFGSTQAKVSHRAERLKVQWDSLPAEFVGAWLALTDPNRFWQGIAPSGFVEQGIVTVDMDQPDSMILSAQVADLAIQSHQSVPGIANLNGDLRIEGASGELRVATEKTSLEMPGLYDRKFEISIPNVTLRWDSSKELGLFADGKATINLQALPQASPIIPVTLNWRSVSPTNLQRVGLGREATFELRVTAEALDRASMLALADNRLIDPNTVALLKYRLEQAMFKDVALTYLTRTDADRHTESQFFLNAQFVQAEMSFLDSWRSVTNMSGTVAMDGRGIRISARDAYYPGFDLPRLSLNLNYRRDDLTVSFDGLSSGDRVMSFLTSGPLRPMVGDRLDDWSLTGPVAVKGKIVMPLESPERFNAQVAAQLTDSKFVLRDLQMGFTDVQGTLNYDTQAGLWSENLTMRHLDLPQRVSLRGLSSEAVNDFTIDVTGETDVAYWGQRFDDAYLKSIDATIEHQTHIDIQSSQVRIHSESDLKGLQLTLPEPFSKPVDDTLMLSLSVDMDARDWIVIRANLGDALISYFELNQNNAIQRGAVAINQPLQVREDNGVYFDINVSAADGDDWWQTVQEIRSLYAQQQSEAEQPGFETLIRSIHITADALDYLAQPWTQVDANLLRNDEAWIVAFAADEGQGQVLIPHSEEIIFTELQWLSLTTGEEDVAFEDSIDPLLNYHPNDVPNMQIQINKLIWNKRDMGSWRAELENTENQLTIREIQGVMAGATLSGNMIWRTENNKHQTAFVGSVAVGNVLDVLNTWEYAPVLNSRSGDVMIDAFWQGSPAHFDFKRLQGKINLSLRKGAILQVEEYEGIKLIGLLNFTRVIQRIALDFSDLLQSGISFDSVEGELLFDRGFARVGEKLIIDGSATKFRFNGDADLLSDELDIDMVLTVPLSSTFPLVALLAGVSPQAAAAIYVTERVFNNELERISSARMHITGSFEAPETKFYRVFDNNLGDQAPTVGDRIKEVVPEGVAKP